MIWEYTGWVNHCQRTKCLFYVDGNNVFQFFWVAGDFPFGIQLQFVRGTHEPSKDITASRQNYIQSTYQRERSSSKEEKIANTCVERNECVVVGDVFLRRYFLLQPRFIVDPSASLWFSRSLPTWKRCTSFRGSDVTVKLKLGDDSWCDIRTSPERFVSSSCHGDRK